MSYRDPYGLAHATRPGRLDLPTPVHIQSYDPPEHIMMCERCTLPECVNCLGRRISGIRECRRREFRRFYGAGLTDAEIAPLMGVKPPTVAYYRRRDGLPPNAPHAASSSPLNEDGCP